jgi:hypothetical protein
VCFCHKRLQNQKGRKGERKNKEIEKEEESYTEIKN